MNEQKLAALDLAVAKAEGLEAECPHESFRVVAKGGKSESGWRIYQPTRDGAEAMRLLEKYGLTLKYEPGTSGIYGPWNASRPWHVGSPHSTWPGDTPAIAICRAVVALKEKK